jgi:acyl-[acyl-carrier-protein] desaturase
MDAQSILHELDHTVEQLLARHLEKAQEWFPHEFVPYGRGRDFEPGTTWSEDDADLAGGSIDDAVRSALYVNLLTEDNLPYYFRSIEAMFGRDGAWGEWGRRWTAEEGRHAMAIYGYLTTTRAIDPVELERGRMAQVSKGEVPEHESPLEGFIYLTLQELATRISHRNTGMMLDDPAGHAVMKRVALDENLHHLFYRDLAAAAIEVDPSAMVKAMATQVLGFEMPGTGIPGFVEHAKSIAAAGIYDLAIHHDQILEPIVMRHWRLAELSGLDAEAEAARTKLITYIERSDRVAKRIARRREERAAARQLTSV